MKDLISVIVPVYNMEKYLERCLTRLVNQTYKNIEIIIVNDGSTDSSQNIINKFQQKYPNIVKSYKKENGGISSTRNYGLKKATGNYIAFVDSDDYVDLDFCEYLYNLLVKNNADISCCHYYINEDLNGSNKKIYIFEKDKILKSFLYESFIKTPIWNKLYKKEIINNRTFEKINIGEDLLFNTYILSECNKVVCSNEAKYHYNTLNVSLTRSTLKIEKIEDSIKAHQLQFEFIKSLNNQELLCKVISNRFNAAYVYYLDIKNDTSKEIKKVLKKEFATCKNEYKKYRKSVFFSKKVYLKMQLVNRFFYLYNRLYKLLKK